VFIILLLLFDPSCSIIVSASSRIPHQVGGSWTTFFWLSDDKISWFSQWRTYFAGSSYFSLYIFLVIWLLLGVSFWYFVPFLQYSHSLFTSWICYLPSGKPSGWELLSWVHLEWLDRYYNILWSYVSFSYTPVHFWHSWELFSFSHHIQ